MRPQRNTRRLFAIALGLLCSALFIALSVRRIDLPALWGALRTSTWWPWYVLAPLIYMTGHFVRGLRCRIILRPHCTISTWTASNVVIAGYAANYILPARMGELVRAYLLSRQAKISVTLSLAITLLERVLDGLVITGLLVIAASMTPLPPWGRELLWVAAAVFLSAAAGVGLVIAAKSQVLDLLEWVTRRLPARFGQRLMSIADRAIAATDCLRDRTLIGPILLLSLVVWLVEGSMFLVILPAFGLAANPLWAAMALTVTNLGILIPSSPGYIGPFHFFCMQALMMFGITRETALGYAIMAHLLYYIPVTIWGISAMAAYGMRFGTAVHTVEVGTEVRPAA